MSDGRFKTDIGIGATDELSLRVSVAALVRVLFVHPQNGQPMLALERRATLLEEAGRHRVQVKSQPFGGAIRMYVLKPLQTLIGNFHFDSEEARAERDFRLFIRPSAWEALREFCLEQFKIATGSILECDPRRELTEEFTEALGVDLKPDQYTYRAVGTIVEDHPSATENAHARGRPTVRLYRIFETHILDSALSAAMLAHSETTSDQHLRELARESITGRANAVLTLPLKQITAFYEQTTLEERNSPISFQSHLLDETVAAVLENLTVPKYRRS